MSRARRRIDFMLPLAALVIALAGAIAGYECADGAALGLAIAGLAIAAIVVPPLVAPARDAINATIVALSYSIGTLAIWLFAMPGIIGWLAFGAASLVLLSFTLAVAGLAQVLSAVRVNLALGGAILTVTALAWLSCPIWLMRGTEVLVGAHPIFAINGTSAAMGVWTQQRLMYRWTALGQDVAYALPVSVWTCVLVHLAVAVAGFIVAALTTSRRAAPERAEGDAPSGQ
jgi:hypothetical protein